MEKLLPLVGTEETPTSKTLQEAVGVKPTLLRRWLEACYADVIQLLATDADALQIDEVIHCLYFHGKRKTTEVRCRLPVTPRLHENVDLNLIGAEVDGYTYYVEMINYEFEADKLLIHIGLQHGYYNAYVEQLKERAYFEGRLTIQDMQELSDYEIKARLKKLYGK